MISGENIEQVQQQIIQLKENDPIQFIHNLLEIITSDQYPDNERIDAIKFLSFPLCSNNQKKSRVFLRLNITEVPDEVVDEVLDVLFTYLTYPEEVSSIARSMFVFYSERVSFQHICATVGKLIQVIQSTESITPELLKMYLKLMDDIVVRCRSTSLEEFRPFFISLLEGKEQCEDDELVSLLLSMLNKTSIAYFDQNVTEDTSLLLSIGLSFAERFPKECVNIISNAMCNNFEECFPDFPNTLFQIISSGPQYSCFFRLIPHPSAENFRFFTDGHLNDLIAIALAVIGEEANKEIDSDDDTPYFFSQAYFFVQNCIYSSNLGLIDDFRAYVAEHLSEEGTCSKFTAALLNYMLRSVRAEDFAKGYDIDQTEVLGALLSDPNQIIYREGLKLMHDLIESSVFTREISRQGSESLDIQNSAEQSREISRESSQSMNRFEITEEVVQVAFDNYNSDSRSLSELGEDLLTTIVSSRNEGANEKIFSTLLEVVQDSEQSEE